MLVKITQQRKKAATHKNSAEKKLTTQELFKKGEEKKLYDAISRNNIESVKSILESSGQIIDINNHSSSRIPPLHQAIVEDNESIVDLLLASDKIDVNLQQLDSEKGRIFKSPLILAFLSGNMHVIDSLLKCSIIDVNLKGEDGEAPINFVANRSSVREAEKILDKLLHHSDVQVNMQDAFGYTALLRAILHEQKELVQLLLKCQETKLDVVPNSSFGFTALHNAILGNNSTEIVELLLQDPRIKGIINLQSKNTLVTALHSAVFRGDERYVDLLLKNTSINPNLTDKKGKSPLHYAVSKGNVEIVKLLLDNISTDLNLQAPHGLTSFMIAIRCRHLEIINLFLARKQDINFVLTDGICNNILHFAVLRQNTDLIKKLLPEYSYLVSQKNRAYNTPVFYAKIRNAQNICDIFKELTGNDFAIFSNSTKLIEAIFMTAPNRLGLIDQQLDRINDTNKWGHTCLYYAIENFDLPVLDKLLTQKNIDVQHVKNHKRFNLDISDNWSTALDLAVSIGDPVVVELLLQYEIITNSIKNNCEVSAIHNVFTSQGVAKAIQKLFLKFQDEHNYEFLFFVKPRTTLLQHAVHANDLSLIKLILQYKIIDTGNLKTPEKIPPLHEAIIKGCQVIVGELVKDERVDVNFQQTTPNREGKTLRSPLILAISQGNIEIIDLILDCPRTDVNLRGEDGNTPINFVVTTSKKIRNPEEVFKKLLARKDVDLTVKNDYSKSPLDNIQNEPSVLKILKDSEGVGNIQNAPSNQILLNQDVSDYFTENVNPEEASVDSNRDCGHHWDCYHQ